MRVYRSNLLSQTVFNTSYNNKLLGFKIIYAVLICIINRKTKHINILKILLTLYEIECFAPVRTLTLYWTENCIVPRVAQFVHAVSAGESVVCYNQPDGVYEVNCRAYTLCVDGEERIVNCEPGLAFNKDSKQCEKYVRLRLQQQRR